MNVYVILMITVAVILGARFVARRKGLPGGWPQDVYAVLGAFFGGWLGQVFDLYQGVGLEGYVMSAATAAFFVAAYRALSRRRTSRAQPVAPSVAAPDSTRSKS